MTEADFRRADLALNFAEVSDIGGRQSNQDAHSHVVQDGLALFVIADGAGGHDGGELAAKTVVASICASFAKESAFSAAAMHSHIDAAVVGVGQAKIGQAHLKDMSATVAAILLDLNHGQAIWAHLGDTRIYLFHRSKVQRITRDHSVAQQFVDAGFWSYDNLRAHPQRNRLFAAIGAEGDTLPEIADDTIPFADGDVFLLCTDGFWEWVDEQEMEHALADSASADEWLRRLCDTVAAKANAAGKSRDNCTAYAIWLGEPAAVTIIR
ncbi:MAG: serine/threonine-protein phosphatase [Burkholderiaceae bacterium]|nr:serine/threonine-protein phosphatase [Burkholderiaceae bacterium]